jgi:hypothetical protein
LTADHLTGLLAERILGWGVGPERFLTGNGGCISRWRFQPTEKLEDALRLLESAAPRDYTIQGGEKRNTRVHVRIAESEGEASEPSKALAITYAIARAFGIEVES